MNVLKTLKTHMRLSGHVTQKVQTFFALLFAER